MDYRVLIIDEHEIDLIILKRTVIKSGIHQNPWLFRSGQEALEHLAAKNIQHSPYLIFLDIHMPLFSGFDFLESLKTLKRNFPIYILIVTSSVEHSDREKSNQYDNVIGFIEKPYTVEEIKQAGDQFKNEISK